MTNERCVCLQQAKAPNFQHYEPVSVGMYIRNLEPDKLSNRFEKDGKPPRFGYRVRPNKWRWDWKTEKDGLSVNSKECAGALRCSILFHATPERFQHVVIIDIAALSQALGIPVVAVYDPNPEQNPCHFNLRPVGKTIQELITRLTEWNERVCAHVKKLPADAELVVSAERDRDAYERVFKVVVDVYVRNEGSTVAAQASTIAIDS